MNSVNQTLTSRRDHVPSPAAIVGNILVFGVVRALARAKSERDQGSLRATLLHVGSSEYEGTSPVLC